MKLPRGVRGLRSAVARASRWNSIDGYVLHADEEICVLVQVESVEGLANQHRFVAFRELVPQPVPRLKPHPNRIDFVVEPQPRLSLWAASPYF